MIAFYKVTHFYCSFLGGVIHSYDLSKQVYTWVLYFILPLISAVDSCIVVFQDPAPDIMDYLVTSVPPALPSPGLAGDQMDFLHAPLTPTGNGHVVV